MLNFLLLRAASQTQDAPLYFSLWFSLLPSYLISARTIRGPVVVVCLPACAGASSISHRITCFFGHCFLLRRPRAAAKLMIRDKESGGVLHDPRLGANKHVRFLVRFVSRRCGHRHLSRQTKSDSQIAVARELVLLIYLQSGRL